MKIVVGIRHDLSFICNDCDGMCFDKGLEELIDNEEWKKPNRCKKCGKKFLNSDEILIGMVYVDKNGNKILPNIN